MLSGGKKGIWCVKCLSTHVKAKIKMDPKHLYDPIYIYCIHAACSFFLKMVTALKDKNLLKNAEEIFL